MAFGLTTVPVIVDVTFFFFSFPAKHQVTQTKPQPISNISPSFLRALCTGSAGSLGNHRITQVEGTLGILYSNLFHCLAVLRVKKLFFISYLNLILSACITLNSLAPSSWKLFRHYWKVAITFPWRLLLSRLLPCNWLQPLLTGQVLQNLTILADPINSLQYTGVFLVLEVPKLDAV